MNSSLTRTELLRSGRRWTSRLRSPGPLPSVACGDEGVGLGFFLGLALDEVFDVRMVDVEDDHLGGATRFAAGLDDAAKASKPRMKESGPGGGAAAGRAARWSRGWATGWCRCRSPT